jgi:hypothetical protein
MKKEGNREKPTKESKKVEERTEYKKPKVTKRGDLKDITALSFNPPS